MTMPSNIYVQEWLEDGEHKYGEWTSYKSFGDDAYIRADLADELARALVGVMHYIQGYAGSDEQDMVDASLARFRAITP